MLPKYSIDLHIHMLVFKEVRMTIESNQGILKYKKYIKAGSPGCRHNTFADVNV